MKQIYLGLGVLIVLAACKPQPPAPAVVAEPAVSEPAAAVAAEVPAALLAAGTEPFWSVHLEAGMLSYTTPETVDQPRLLKGTREQRGGTLTVQGGEGNEAFKLTISGGPCSDGMSDLSHPFNAEFVLGTQTFKGCARDPAVPVAAP